MGVSQDDPLFSLVNKDRHSPLITIVTPLIPQVPTRCPFSEAPICLEKLPSCGALHGLKIPATNQNAESQLENELKTTISQCSVFM